MKPSRLTAAVVSLSLFALAPTWAKQSAPLADGELDLARKLESAFVKVAEQASESVVVITCTRHVEARADGDDRDEELKQFDGTPFEYFFRNHPMPNQPPRDIDSEGSGIIYRKDGYIVTNNHVVDGADKIKVRLKDGTEYEARPIGSDDRTDVAVIRVDAKNLPAARLGNSEEVRPGQWAIAIGSPFELDYSFTVGFVSAKGRPPMDARTVATIDYIQTDASINPGNSGGPLCDIGGRVIGMNTAIRGLNRGIGFAIPVNLVRETAEQLIDNGRVVYPWIGISIEPLTENRDKESLGDIKGVKGGVVVREIKANTPAAKSDLKQADIIVGVDGVPVKTPKELQLQILHKKVGQTVALDIIRDGKPIQIAIQTAEMNEELRTASRRSGSKPKSESAFGLNVQTLTKDLAKQFEVGEAEGVVVTDVAEGSPAAQKGLQRGDVITEVNRLPVRNAEDFRAAMDKADAGKGVLIFLKHNGGSTFVVLKEK